MGAGQLEAGAGVVKRPVAPLDRIVAGLARRREICGSVVHRGDRVGVVVLMARNARRAGQAVVVVHVAIGTLPRRYRVRAGKGKSGAAVIECRIQPRSCFVALLAGLWEVRGDMVRICRTLIILEVATDARVCRQVVIVVDMTIGALSRRDSMHSRQRKVRVVVVKRGVRPRSDVVALLAGLGEIG